MTEIVTIGDATLYHGDCLEILPTLDKVDAVVTSPPYAEQRSSEYASVSARDYPKWGCEVIKSCARVAPNVFWNIKEHADGGRADYVYRMVLEVVDSGVVWVDEFIWAKTNPFPTGGSRRLKDGFERIYHFSSGDHKIYPDNVARPSTSVWAGDGERRRNKGEFDTKSGSGLHMGRRVTGDVVRPSNVLTLPSECASTNHPAVFPVGLPYFFISLSSHPGGIIADPFAGSGTTGVACANLGRKFIGIEIERKYFDIACERIEAAYAQGRLFA